MIGASCCDMNGAMWFNLIDIIQVIQLCIHQCLDQTVGDTIVQFKVVTMLTLHVFFTIVCVVADLKLTFTLYLYNRALHNLS